MIKEFLHKVLSRRHFWRDTTFNELNEIYIAMLVRGMSISMVGLFVPVYMLKLDYTLTDFLTLEVCYFAVRVFADFGAAQLVARFGPKHILILAQFLLSIASLLFLTLENVAWPLWLLGAVWGISQSCFFVSFDVDFSKIKHKLHGGKELSYVEMMSKVGAIAGPLLGGLLAFFVGPQYIFLASTLLLIVGLRPLLMTREPTRIKQKLHYRDFDATEVRKLLVPVAALNIENTLSIMLWPLFLAIFVLPGDSVFVKLGALSAISMGLSILAAHHIGKMVDRKQGRRFLRASAVLNSGLHLTRPFIGSYGLAIGLNTTNEIITLGYRLPFLKAYYDQADKYPGHRIVFISALEALASLCKGVVYGILLIVSLVATTKATLSIAFIFAAIASLLIMSEKFESLNAKKSIM